MAFHRRPRSGTNVTFLLAHPPHQTDSWIHRQGVYNTRDQPENNPLDQDIRALLQALPTRTNIEALILHLEETHHHNIQEVREDVSNIADRVTVGEASFSTLEYRVAALAQSRDYHRDTAIALQLHLEDIEDRSRRNNLRLCGIPEGTDTENLGEQLR